jgi:hypothetical protein
MPTTLSMRGEIVEVRNDGRIVATILADQDRIGAVQIVSEHSITAIPGDTDDDKPLCLLIKFGIAK